MKQRMFSIFDVKARAYLPPFFMPERGMAVRVFGDCVNDASHQFGKHPEDYTLFELAVFDDSAGTIVLNETGPEVIVTGVQCVRSIQ